MENKKIFRRNRTRRKTMPPETLPLPPKPTEKALNNLTEVRELILQLQRPLMIKMKQFEEKITKLDLLYSELKKERYKKYIKRAVKKKVCDKRLSFSAATFRTKSTFTGLKCEERTKIKKSPLEFKNTPIINKAVTKVEIDMTDYEKRSKKIKSSRSIDNVHKRLSKTESLSNISKGSNIGLNTVNKIKKVKTYSIKSKLEIEKNHSSRILMNSQKVDKLHLDIIRKIKKNTVKSNNTSELHKKLEMSKTDSSQDMSQFNNLFVPAQLCDCESSKSINPSINDTCGGYCKNLSAKEQIEFLRKTFEIPRYIREAQEYAISAEWWRSWCDYINIEFQTIRSIEFNNENQLLKLFANSHKTSLNLKSYKNPDSKNCDVEFESNPLCKNPSGLIKDISDQSWNSQILEDSYCRPHKIKNKEIVDINTFVEYSKKDKIYKLKDNLKEIYDYVKVDSNAWAYFKHWYDCDYEILV
ncbi:unnamed protein product [Moneuplotes crassus]|uniref:DUSP domain-containing protein n=1 Tax=Euplotes crassus TaxID=5936 RepID=A0AAD1UEM9_EUPCR|nr:unnamed protein product [Moneuplotes crassus]